MKKPLISIIASAGAVGVLVLAGTIVREEYIKHHIHPSLFAEQGTTVFCGNVLGEDEEIIELVARTQNQYSGGAIYQRIVEMSEPNNAEFRKAVKQQLELNECAHLDKSIHQVEDWLVLANNQNLDSVLQGEFDTLSADNLAANAQGAMLALTATTNQYFQSVSTQYQEVRIQKTVAMTRNDNSIETAFHATSKSANFEVKCVAQVLPTPAQLTRGQMMACEHYEQGELKSAVDLSQGIYLVEDYQHSERWVPLAQKLEIPESA
ncbi:hypothetical protein J4N42_14725 [Vibrio sp. SCSIO 43135]|uniref:Uncharacterized protein n=1 Tax=Vibrio paucivorans TaxID=2829489 RepID=A0A9X3HTY6_9VIBR|nr:MULTISPECIES: hypothetical protein [Vibrio]MCW8336295.1 hypothetical protein [Vibrio paucivorans]USD43433.1 hypothetical protein J4N42_14725 [Vibrio sp. SCSIO 43135]